MRRLEIGPGKERLPGFETLNIIRTPITDHVGDARRPPFPPGSFDLVYSSHCIEHIEWYEVADTIKAWAALLRPGGQLEVFTVDAAMLMAHIVDWEATGEWHGPMPGAWKQGWHKGDPISWAVGRLMNYQRKGSKHHIHRSLITMRLLERWYTEAGLTQLEKLGDADARGKRHGIINMGLRGTRC